MMSVSGRFCFTLRWSAFSLAPVLLFFSCALFAGEGSQPEPQQVVHLGPGVHKIDQVVLSNPHAVLEGEGKGVTILIVPNGVLCTGTNPIIRNLTIVGSGKGVGLTLRNTWSAQVIDVEVESFATGVKLELNEDGRKRAGTTKQGWPSALTPGQWGSRMTLTELRGVNITGQGDGLVMYNLLKEGNKGNGEFFTGTTIWGGHIAVQGKAVVMGNNVWQTRFIGTYIDIGPGGGLYMEAEARWLDLVGVSLDLNYAARKVGAYKVSAASDKAVKSIQYVATTLEEKEINVSKKNWVNRLIN